jgi:hypothetical protein
LAPIAIETVPDAMLASIIGTKNGVSRFGPRPSTISVPCSKVSMPPMPVPISTPTRVAFSAVTAKSAAASASNVAATANWV